jgi:pyridoxine kinase
MGYDSVKDEYYYYSHDKLEVSYHGTGDIFSSTCIGAMMNDMTWKEAMAVAADYTAECIRLTLEDPSEPWYGVNFEQAIPYLLKRIGK